jgi:hypothetical protein
MWQNQKRQGQSLEDAIRGVQQKYRGRPSPLMMMQENVGYIPTHVPDHMRPTQDLRSGLLSGFRPPNDTFR